MKTTFVINEKLMLDIESVIFAEIAAPGAMGAAGIVSIFALNNGKIKCYSFDSNEASERESYNNCDELLKFGSNNGFLDYQYAGYGNHAFKKHDVVFERDDDNHTLIFVGEKQQKIQVSNVGVYSHIIGAFAKNPVDIIKLHSIIKDDSLNLSEEERAFLKVYIDQSERLEKGMPWFDITVSDYNDAVSYIKFRHGDNVEDYKPEEYTSFGIESIQKYRLKYIVEKNGWARLHRFIEKFISGSHKDLFVKLDKILDEKQKISEKFMKIRNGKSDNTEITSLGGDGLKHLFDYPVIVNFEPETRKTINQKICELGIADLRANADNVAYYLMNYFWHLFDWGFEEIEPVVWFVIDNCPNDDFNGTGTDKLFWIASHIINTHWKRLGGKENDEFEKKVIIHFSPRVGGVWPIVHYGEYRMNDPAADFILHESIGYILCVGREKWLPGIEDFLMTEKALNSSHPTIKHFAEEIQSKTS